MFIKIRLTFSGCVSCARQSDRADLMPCRIETGTGFARKDANSLVLGTFLLPKAVLIAFLTLKTAASIRRLANMTRFFNAQPYGDMDSMAAGMS